MSDLWRERGTGGRGIFTFTNRTFRAKIGIFIFIFNEKNPVFRATDIIVLLGQIALYKS